jgi:hypothetical protein
MRYLPARTHASDLRQWQRDVRDAIDGYELRMVDLMNRGLPVPKERCTR